MIHLDTNRKDAVLRSMVRLIDENRHKVLAANATDLSNNKDIDQVLIDRLKVNPAKIDGMIKSLQEVIQKPDPINQERYSFTHDNGMHVVNRSAPFGTVLIIYESRPDVTVEAAAIAFKSGNRIILKGGKEAFHSNSALVECWHQALLENELTETWITYLKLSRKETQAYFIDHKEDIDLVVPRGGEGLIQFVKTHARCPVLVSGRGNNFLYLDKDGDQEMALSIILNGKTGKISACNALDKVLVHNGLYQKKAFLTTLEKRLKENSVSIYSDLPELNNTQPIRDEKLWYEEFLDFKIMITGVENQTAAIEKINKYSGGHSVTIVTNSQKNAEIFMQEVDAAAVYHNASTRFTDGGQFGLGAELAISTDKMHHRGPLGLEQLVTNKWYVYGQGQVR